MTSQNVYADVMSQAAQECAPDLPADANEDLLAAMKAHHGLLICEMGQDTFEATEALVAQDIARRELWNFVTPYREPYRNADHMIYTLITRAGRSRSRLCIMRAVGAFCQFAEWHNIETDAAVRNWTNCREVYSNLKDAAKAENPELLQAILSDVVAIKSRDEIREKYKSTSDKPKAGVGRLFWVDGIQYFLGRIDDGERAGPGISKLFDTSDNNGFGVTHKAIDGQVQATTYQVEKVEISGLWDEALESESVTVPR